MMPSRKKEGMSCRSGIGRDGEMGSLGSRPTVFFPALDGPQNRSEGKNGVAPLGILVKPGEGWELAPWKEREVCQVRHLKRA